jgi:hypothetical protein
MNAKAKGSRNERKTIKLLEAVGYACMKAGASLGVFDVIGISLAEMVCVQVKSNRWPSSAETEAIALFPVPPNCRKLVHVWMDRQSVPKIKEID